MTTALDILTVLDEAIDGIDTSHLAIFRAPRDFLLEHRDPGEHGCDRLDLLASMSSDGEQVWLDYTTPEPGMAGGYMWSHEPYSLESERSEFVAAVRDWVTSH